MITDGEPGTAASAQQARRNWLTAIRAYLVLTFAGHLLWEVLQLPLYTIWTTGTKRELAFAVAHCTGGDILIALSSLIAALILVGDHGWPAIAFGRVAALAVVIGVLYTGFSEWLNVAVRRSWAYADVMPIVSIFGARIGLAPLLQWIVVPVAAFAITRDLVKRGPASGGPP